MIKKAFLCSLLFLLAQAFVSEASAQNQAVANAPAEQGNNEQKATEDADIQFVQRGGASRV